MFNLKNSEGYPYCFPIYYAFNYMMLAVFSIFMPVYLNGLGYDNGQVGILLALGSFVALFAQPLWGVASDRAKTKNSVLTLLLFISAFIIILYRLSTNYYYIFSLMIILAFFQTPINAISDAVTLEHMAGTRWKFGPIRFAGTMGYACIAVVAGLLAKENINGIFVMAFAIGLVTFLISFSLPKIQGHQSKGNRVSMLQLFKNRELMVLIFFTVTIHITLSFYNAFFAIYYKDMGADSFLLGWAVFIGAVSEVFFLLKGDKIIERLGIKLTLLGAAFIAVVRWFLFGFVDNIYLIMALQVLHGFIFIVMAYSMATYINREVPKELKASGQTFNSVISIGLSKLIGNIGGGMLSDRIGIRHVFLLGSLTVFVSMVIFGIMYVRSVRKTETLNV